MIWILLAFIAGGLGGMTVTALLQLAKENQDDEE